MKYGGFRLNFSVEPIQTESNGNRSALRMPQGCAQLRWFLKTNQHFGYIYIP